MPPREPSPRQSGLLSIGALSAATGIPGDTIRTWERRYGFPVPVRKPSGHRVYPLETVPRLRRVAQALARGHRPAEVLPASERDLDALLAALPQTSLAGARGRDLLTTSQALDGAAVMREAVRAFDADRLKREFQTAWGRLGPLEFLEQRAAGFLRDLGDGWDKGELEVRHEHFGSAVLGDFLRTVRAPLDDRAEGPIAALATLPGELHGLGLQMAALVFSLAGWRALVLGVDTPVAQIVALAREAPLAAVALSCVQPRGSSSAVAAATLRRRLPPETQLILGGSGAPVLGRRRGVEVFPNLVALDQWLQTR